MSDGYTKDGKGLRKSVSRRGLFMGMVNRFRGDEESGQNLESLDADELEGDKRAAAGHWPEAATAYRKALAQQPGMDGVRAKLGRCLYHSGQYLLARVECTRVVRRRDSRLASLYLGLTHAREGNLDRAAEAWKKYYNPDAPQVMREINVVLAHLEAGNPPSGPEAAEAVERALGKEG